VLYWGGLRGAISLALAISLPAKLGPIRGDIQAMAFGVVLFTLLVQGLTMRPLIRKMGLIQHSESQYEYERRHARALMSRAAYERLKTMQHNGFLSEHVWETLKPVLEQHTNHTGQAVRNIIHTDPEFELEEYNTARREALLQQRSTLATLLRDGIISEEIFSELAAEVDQAQAETHINWFQATRQVHPKKISELVMAIIQEEDVEKAVAALHQAHIPIARMPSAGEFLGHRNVTILLGAPQGETDLVVRTLQQSLEQRVQIVSSPDAAQTAPEEVTIGATLFSFEIERYEVL
jgi:NhaP-type Na+/H+ or K+/H+ antiporter